MIIKRMTVMAKKKCRCILRAVDQAEIDVKSKRVLSSHAAGNGDSAIIRNVVDLV